jgi:chromosomal replication initiator protein
MNADLFLDFEEISSFNPFMTSLHESIKVSLGEAIFYAWFKDMNFKSFDGHTLILTVKNDKIKNCIFLHYQNRFEKILKKTFQKHFNKKLQNFDLIVTNEAQNEACIEVLERTEKSIFNLEINLQNKYTFQNFLETEENKLAVRIAKHFADCIIKKSDEVLHFSKQFFIHGAIGNGKTHLAQAIAHEVAKYSSDKILYTTAERFLFNYQTSVKNNTSVEFTREFIGIKFLIIDDLHFIATKKKTMDEIQRAAYSIISDGGFVLFCSSGSPSELPIESEKVRSFLSTSYVIKIENPTEEFRYKLLKFKAGLSSYKISDITLKTLASKIHTNVRELEGAMARMVLHSHILDYEIDPESTRFITTDIFPHKELKRFSITAIQAKVCSNFGISLEDLTSKKRAKKIVQVRQVAIFISSKLTTESYIEIGRCFKRTHSTVIHSIKAINKACEISRTFKDEINILKMKIEDAN